MNIVSAALAPAQQVADRWEQWLPPMLMAMLILIIGWALAKALRFVTIKALHSVNFHVLTDRAGLDEFLTQGGARAGTVELVASLVWALVLLTALVLALNTLGLTDATRMVTRAALFVPRLIVAVVLLSVGLYFGRFVAQMVSGYSAKKGLMDAALLGRFAQSLVVVFVVLMVLDEIQIGQGIIRDTFLIILSGVTLAFALAFGLGGQKWAAGVLEQQWPREATHVVRKPER